MSPTGYTRERKGRSAAPWTARLQAADCIPYSAPDGFLPIGVSAHSATCRYAHGVTRVAHPAWVDGAPWTRPALPWRPLAAAAARPTVEADQSDAQPAAALLPSAPWRQGARPRPLQRWPGPQQVPVAVICTRKKKGDQEKASQGRNHRGGRVSSALRNC